MPVNRQVVPEPIAALEHQRLVVPECRRVVVVDAVRQRRAHQRHGRRAVLERDKVFDEVRLRTPCVGGTRVTATYLTSEAQREFLGERRGDAVGHLHIHGREAGKHHARVVRQVEGWRKISALSCRPGVDVIHFARAANRSVDGELHLAVLAGIMAVGAGENRLPVAGDVVRRRQARDNRMGIHRLDVTRRRRTDHFEAGPEVEGEARVDHPAILRVERGRLDIDRRATRRLERPHLAGVGREHRNRRALRIAHCRTT